VRPERSALLGFFINLYVQADSTQQAEFTAMQTPMLYEGLRGYVRKTKEDTTVMYVEEIQKISNYAEIDPKIEELVWHSEINNHDKKVKLVVIGGVKL
jgi:hypothetical protein